MASDIKAWIPKPKFIVWTILTLVLLTFVLKAAGGNQYVAKAKAWMGLSV